MTTIEMQKARLIFLRAKNQLTPLARTGIKLLWGFDHCESCGDKGPFDQPDPNRLGRRHPDAIVGEVQRLWPLVRRSTDPWT